MSVRRGSALALLLGGLAVAAAGCGGGSKSPGVANLGTDANTTSTSSGAPSGSGPSTSTDSGSGNNVQMMMPGGQHGLEFSRCMRSHGVSNFPDPNGQGAIQIGPSSGIDPRSSTFQSAVQACHRLVGGGSPPTPAQEAKAKQDALAFSACMRKHGLPDFPDPTFSGGTVQMGIQGKPGSDLNPNSPTFQAAQQACQGHLSKGLPNIRGSSGGK